MAALSKQVLACLVLTSAQAQALRLLPFLCPLTLKCSGALTLCRGYLCPFCPSWAVRCQEEEGAEATLTCSCQDGSQGSGQGAQAPQDAHDSSLLAGSACASRA